MKPPSLHSNFFTSLKQVEKRLKSEHPELPPPPPLESSNSLQESVSTPIYIESEKPSRSFTYQESSEAPSGFLSVSPPVDDTEISPPKQVMTTNELEPDSEPIDDIEMLIQLLGLSEEKGKEMVGVGVGVGDRDCEGGFYSKIVGFKGPKSGKEVERLEGWIKHFMNNGEEEKLEPFRLAHLLLGKAVFVSERSDCGFEGLEFPSTLEEFLQNDPPQDT